VEDVAPSSAVGCRQPAKSANPRTPGLTHQAYHGRDGRLVARLFLEAQNLQFAAAGSHSAKPCH
jgi:hypothetical protein